MRTFRRVTPHAESLITLARRAAVLVLAAAKPGDEAVKLQVPLRRPIIEK